MRKLKLSTLSSWIIALFVLFTSSNLVYSQCATGTVEGTVYLDENKSGVNESEVGYPNAVVTIYDENNSQVGMALSNSNGIYSISGLTDGLIYRVEFTLPNTVSAGYVSGGGSSDVQFAEVPTCDINLPVSNRALECGAQDDLVLTCFVRSDGSDNLDYPTVIGVDFGFDQSSTPVVYATQAETGSVWGTAYRYSSSDIFTSAFIKQNSALGSNHDAIYRTVPSGAGYSTSIFTTLSALGQTVGNLAETDPFNCDYGNQVGHLGLGGLAISADENDLYVINIGDNSLVKLSATNPTAATTISYQIPDPGCGTNENKPFALTEYNGRYYIGVTCTAESTRTSSQSSITVYEFDPNTAAFTQMFTTNATKGYWLDSPNTSNKIQQWLTDIAFTDEGNMALALSDRKGHRYCEGPGFILNDQEGDLLLVANVNGQWVLENNGQAGNFQGSGMNNGDGPGGGEFFSSDYWLTDPSYHNETSLGSIYALPSTGEIVSAVFDPITDAYSGGLHRYHTSNGSKASAVQLYGNNSAEFFGKATGFGGITGKCGYAGIQIGNLAWFDFNNNGVQDPEEDPIDGLPLCLFDSNGTKLGSTTTDSNGHYIFSSANHGLGYNGTYYIAIDPIIFNAADGTYTFNNYVLTPSFDTNVALNNSNLLFPPAGTSSNIPDVNHIINSGMPFITVMTGGNGENDYTFDIGLAEVEYFDLALILLSETRFGEEGDDVKYTIEIENQGDVTANNIKVINYIPEGMTLNDPNWTLAADGLSAHRYINLDSGLAPGDMTEDCITLTIEDRGEDYVKVNYAEIAYSENNAGVDFSPKDIDSTPDEINDNDFGGEAFSINDNRLDGSGVAGDDEDDHDSEGLYFVTYSISDPCECEGIDADGNVVHNESVTIQGPKGQIWTVDANIGLHDAAGVLIPVGTVIPVFDATDPLFDVYQIDGTLINGNGFILRAMNEDGIFLNIEGQGCAYADLVITGNSACIGSIEEYSVSVSDNCTYIWSIDPAVPFTDLANGTIEVEWAGAGDFVITATPNCPDNACAPPATLPVTVGIQNGLLACPLDLNISLDSECSVTITPEMILTTPVVSGVAYGIMITDSHGNVIPGTELNGDHLGQTLTVKVIDACSGNACWSNIIVEDKTAPVLLCEPIEVPCYDVNTYEPIAYDACTSVDVEIIADFPTPLWCDDDYVKSIERTYKATDAYGNSTTCSQTILVKRFPYEDIVTPDEEVIITCEEAEANQNAEGYPSACLTGVPTLFGASLYGEAGCESDLHYDYCNINFSYTDVLYYVGDCKTKYMRTWHYYENNCTPWNYQNFTQLIVVEDSEDPVFDVTLDTHNEIITSNGNTCEANYVLPVPVVSDDCAVALTYNVTYTTEAGIPTLIDGLTIDDFNTGITIVLPFGDNVIKYTVFDGCDNFTEDMFIVTIVDETSPQAVCEGNTVISLNEDGTAYAPAIVFDDGSYDDCGPIEILVQRESVCDCPIPTFDGLNYLGSYDDGSGTPHYYYNSVRMVRGYLATSLASAYGGYLVDFNSTAEQAYISNLMMVDAYVGGPDYTSLSGGVTALADGLALQSFIIEIENPCGWSNEVHFCCEDYDADPSTVDVEVSIRVIDAFGNIGECVPVNVYIQNKVIPLLDCPDSVELTCTDSDLSEDHTTEEDLNTLYGTFTTDVCGAIIVPTTVWELDACGVGVITRTFSALNTSNNSPILDINGDAVECVMTITITNDDPLTVDDITWPEDYLEFEVECAMTDLHPDVLAEIDAGQYGYPVVPIGDCHYATNPTFTDSQPFVTPDGRVKIIRTWTIFDECNDHNELTYIQRIKVTDLNLCEMLDVALRKTVVTPGPYNGGDVVTFAIEVFNQGNVDAFNIGLVDYIPSGLTFAVGTVNNANWTSIDANTAVLTNPIPTIAAGDPDPSTTVLIDLVIDGTAAGNYDNFAEVTSVTNDPNDDPLTDIDSTPDDLNNDVFMDDVIGSDPVGGDEDDHDIETIFVEVFDLALIKQVNETLTDEPLMPSGAIAFDITIMNQGNVDAFNIQVADYFPVELVLDDTNWSAVGNTATLNTPIPSLAVGQSTTVTIIFAVQDYSFFDDNNYDFSDPLSIFNNAEISAADDINGPATDIDSEPGDNGNDDEDLNNDDEFDDGDGTQEEDDDFDPSDFEIDIYDLAIDKALLTVGPYSPGDNITFSLTVTNEGTLDAANIQITDMPDAGLIFVSDDSGTNSNVTSISGGLVYDITSLVSGASETVEVTYMIDANFMGSSLNNYVEITTDDGDDVDSDPDNDSDDEDDDDDEVIPLVQIFDLALIKEINTTLTNDPLEPGGSITFDITVLNQGTLDATNVVVSDYFPAELILNDANWSAVGNTATLNTPIPLIPAGMSSVVSITFTLEDYAYFVANGIDLSDGITLVNDAEVTAAEDNGVAVITDADGTYGDNANDPSDLINDDSFGDGDGTSPQDDDFDPAEFDVDIYDLAIDKTLLTAGPYAPGDNVTFSLTVTNEGTLDAANIQITDMPAAGLNFVSDDSGANANVIAIAGGTIYEITSLPAGATETVEVTYMIDINFMGNSLNNYVEITTDDGNDVDSDPDNDSDDEDDDDEEVITLVQIFDLALIKEINTTLTDDPLLPGGSITFDITVLNQGTLDATNVVVSDYFPVELILNDANWTAVGNTATLNTPITLIPAGMSSVVTITFTLEDYAYFVDNGIDLSMGLTLVNDAEVTAAEDNGVAVITDADGTYGDNSADPSDLINDDSFGDGDGTSPQDDDFDPAEFDVDIYDLAITKTLVPNADQPPYIQGDVVDFEIVITNQGSLTASGVQFTDTPQTGFTFSSDNSAGNANISVITVGSVWSVGTLAPGASETLTVSYTIDLDFVGSTLTNDVMITLDDGDDIDSDPSTGDDVDEDGDMDGDDDDEDEVVVPIGCTIPTCGDLALTISLPVSMDIPVMLYPYVDMNNMVQISTTPVIPTGFEGCQNTFTVTLDKDEIACNPKNNEDVKITILDVVAGTEECCVVTITKLDEIPPELTCQDFTVNCNTLFFDADGNVDIEPFEPEATDNCEPVEITSTVDMSGLDEECNTGTIVIMYTATDCYENTDMCTQTITVNAVELQEAEITFPDDITLDSCDDSTDPADTGTATVSDDASVCGGLSIDFEDDVPGDGECQEVITRTWTVIDSCALIGTGVFTHVQTITVTDDLAPVITGLPVLDNTYEVLPPSCMVFLEIIGTASDACSQIDSMYHVINGDTILNSLDASDDFDIGSYTIEFVAVDVCGNKVTEELEFTVAEPIVPPGISCLKLTFEVGPDGPTIVTAEELAFGGFNCSDSDFTYEFVAGDPGSDTEPDDPIVILGDQSIDCTSLAPYFIYIGLFEDGEYTGDFCIAEIDPVDVNPMDCMMNNDEGSNFTGGVFGKIATETGTIVSDVEVGIIGDMTDMDMSTDEGKYEIGGLSEGGIYRVTPVKDIEYRNGVSTLDIIVIQRHLLGLQDLDSPYKHIAADINRSQTITAQDISELRKLILEVTDEFADNTSWRMVDAGYEFIEDVNPLTLNFPERYDIYDFENVMEVDFVGVKIGDVNNSAQGPQGPGIATVVRQSQSLLTYTDSEITLGKSQKVTLKLESEEAYYGFQTRLDIDETLVDLVSITSELPGFGPEHYTYVDGLLTVSYNTPSANEVKGGEITLTLSATKTTSVVDVLQRDDTYGNEIYTAQGINEIILSSISGYSGFEVFQNSPNPFSDYTTIRYKLDESKEVSVKVYDVTGKVIFTDTYNGTTGLNAIQLDKSLFTASGMHYYELTNGSQGVVKRMLYVK